jgi:hypothetical protein
VTLAFLPYAYTPLESSACRSKLLFHSCCNSTFRLASETSSASAAVNTPRRRRALHRLIAQNTSQAQQRRSRECRCRRCTPHLLCPRWRRRRRRQRLARLQTLHRRGCGCVAMTTTAPASQQCPPAEMTLQRRHPGQRQPARACRRCDSTNVDTNEQRPTKHSEPPSTASHSVTTRSTPDSNALRQLRCRDGGEHVVLGEETEHAARGIIVAVVVYRR